MQGGDRMEFFKKKDLIVIAVLLLSGAAGAAFYHLRPAGENLRAEISYNSDVIAVVPIDGDVRELPVPGHENVVLSVGGGEAAFIISDCPDKICVHTGRLKKSGQSAACLPNKIIVRIISDKGNELDDIAQ